MDLINGKMVVTEPQEFDLFKAQLGDLPHRHQAPARGTEKNKIGYNAK
jgi:hypothetical protein